MSQIGSVTTRTLQSLLRGENGLSSALRAISLRENAELPTLTEAQVVAQNVANELAERGSSVKYPILYLYCDRVTNLLREKFRRFSGKARLNIEIRASQDRLEGLERMLQLYVDAVTDVLDSHRGDWGQGGSYAGGYEVLFSAVKQGGKNFVQAAKVVFEIDISQ